MEKTAMKKRCTGIFRFLWVTHVLLLFIFTSIPVEAGNFLQGHRVNLNMSNVSLKKVIEEIKKQTNLSFVYNELDIKGLGLLDMQAENQTVEEVLNRILKNKRLRYEIVDNVIIIRRDNRVVSDPEDEKKTIKGHVTDEDKVPLPGVAVRVKGTTVGVATDMEGNYTLVYEDKGHIVLEFSFVGMKTHEEKPGNRSVLNVQLQSMSTDLEEVMVVAYGTTKKEAFTGSAVSVSGEQVMKEAADAISPEKALKGYVAGVRISRGGGQPGETVGLQIRGIGSISESTNPLYVVDGVPLSEDFDLNNLNPNDIEQMTVLKDAAATSLYGSRASAGVIIITTKKGQQGKTRFELTYERGFSSEAIKRQLKGYYMNGSEYTEYAVEAIKNYYLYSQNALPGMADENRYLVLQNDARVYALRHLNEYAKVVHPDDPLDGSFDYENLTEAQLEKYLTHPRNYNWYDAMFKKGSEDKINFSARGGTEKNNFYASLGYLRQSGITEGSDFKRFTARLALNNKVAQWLNFSVNQSIAYTEQESKLDSQGATVGNPISNLRAMNPTQPIYLPNGQLNQTPGFNSTDPNFLETISLDRDRTKWFSSTTNLSVTVNITNWLKFTTTNAADIRYSRYLQTWDPSSNQGATNHGEVNETRSFYTNIVSSNILTLTKSFGLHHVGATGVYEAKRQTYDFLDASGYNLPVGRLLYMSNASLPNSVGGYDNSDRLISWVAKLDYNYDNKYYLSGSWRRDGTSRFLASNRWGDFWSVSAAWNLTRESFMESTQNWLDNLRAKVSYGTNGTQPGNYYRSLSLFSINYTYMSDPAYQVSSYGNPHLTWESSYTWNAGIDFSLFKNRLRGTFEYYNKHTVDLINNASTPYTSGWSSMTVNEGELRNTGLEITLDSRNFIRDDFSWETNFNISYMRAKVEKLKKDKESGNYIYREGEHLYSYYLREYAGIDTQTGRSQWYKNTKGEDGKTVIDHTAISQDPSSDVEKVINKKGYPDWFGGLTNRFTYKGFDLSFLLTFTIGGTLFDSQYALTVRDGASLGNGNVRFDAYKKAWKKPGDNGTPIIVYNDPFKSNYTSTRSLRSSDHLKIKNISLGYTFPKKWIGRLGLSELRLYVNGNDIYTFYGVDYLNPEVNNSGSYNSYSYPSLRTWRFGIDIKF